MKTHEITFTTIGFNNMPVPVKRVKADIVRFDEVSNMLNFIEGDRALDSGEKIVYRVDRNAVLAVETF